MNTWQLGDGRVALQLTRPAVATETWVARLLPSDRYRTPKRQHLLSVARTPATGDTPETVTYHLRLGVYEIHDPTRRPSYVYLIVRPGGVDRVTRTLAHASVAANRQHTHANRSNPHGTEQPPF